MKPNTRKQIDSIIDELCDNPAEMKAGIDHLEGESRIVNALLEARRTAGLTQRELAKACGMSAAKICRMESGNDAALRFGDVQAYLKGTGATFRLSVHPPRRPHPRPRRPLRAARVTA
jgi:Trp operon repressor